MFNPKSFKDITINGAYLYRKGYFMRDRLRKADIAYELRLVKNRRTGEIDFDPPPYYSDWVDRLCILFTGRAA